MANRTLVWHEPTNEHVILDHPSQISDYVNAKLGRPPESSVEVIPKEFFIYDGIPHFELGDQT